MTSAANHNDSSDIDVCPICYEKYDMTTYQLNCTHMFHNNCIVDYISHTAKEGALNSFLCPLCRKPHRDDDMPSLNQIAGVDHEDKKNNDFVDDLKIIYDRYQCGNMSKGRMLGAISALIESGAITVEQALPYTLEDQPIDNHIDHRPSIAAHTAVHNDQDNGHDDQDNDQDNHSDSDQD